MLLKFKTIAHQKRKTEQKANIKTPNRVYRPTDYYSAPWVTEGTTCQTSHNITTLKDKKPVRIVLKSPYHYKKPKHRVTHSGRCLHIAASIATPTPKTTIKTSNVQEITLQHQVTNLWLLSFYCGSPTLPISRATIKTINLINLWSS